MTKAQIHFMVDDPTAQIPFQRPNTQTRTVDKGFCRPACQGPKATMPKHATGEADAVTCVKCKATTQWKAAMAALLAEREVELTDAAWAGLPMTAEQQEELAAETKLATPAAAVVPAVVATPGAVPITPVPPPVPTPPDPAPITPAPTATPETPTK
jgi:hypothetical protein